MYTETRYNDFTTVTAYLEKDCLKNPSNRLRVWTDFWPTNGSLEVPNGVIAIFYYYDEGIIPCTLRKGKKTRSLYLICNCPSCKLTSKL